MVVDRASRRGRREAGLRGSGAAPGHLQPRLPVRAGRRLLGAGRRGQRGRRGRIDVRRDGQPEPWAWTGSLRVTLQQRAGGFSDAVDVPLELLPPPGSGAPRPDRRRPAAQQLRATVRETATGAMATSGNGAAPGTGSNGTRPGNGAGGSPRRAGRGQPNPPPASTGQSGSAGGPTPPSAGRRAPRSRPTRPRRRRRRPRSTTPRRSSGEATGDAAEPTVADATATDDPVAGADEDQARSSSHPARRARATACSCDCTSSLLSTARIWVRTVASLTWAPGRSRRLPDRRPAGGAPRPRAG